MLSGQLNVNAFTQRDPERFLGVSRQERDSFEALPLSRPLIPTHRLPPIAISDPPVAHRWNYLVLSK